MTELEEIQRRRYRLTRLRFWALLLLGPASVIATFLGHPGEGASLLSALAGFTVGSSFWAEDLANRLIGRLMLESAEAKLRASILEDRQSLGNKTEDPRIHTAWSN